MTIERRERRPDVASMTVDRCGDELVLGLEVVVDVADRHLSGVGDVGQRRGLDALLVENLACARDQPLPLSGPQCPPVWAVAFV